MCYSIDEIRERTIPVARKYGVGSMSLFGSYARGSANDESDVDLYIDKGQIKGLISYFLFVEELEKVLQCHVDVVTTGIEDKEFLARIQKEGVLLYEA